MGRYKVLILILALILVLGAECDLMASKDKKGEENFKGTEGLVLSFVDGAPPNEIWKDIDFGIWVDVQNKGVNDVKDGNICVVSLHKDIFGGEDGCQSMDGEMLGRRNYPGGEIRTYQWNGFRVKEDYEINADLRYPFTAKACYNYNTVASPLVCVKDLEMNVKEAVCDAGEIKLESGGQGAPVEVTYLKEDIIPRGDKNELAFTIKVKNSGDGEVISEELNKDCNFDRKEKNKLKLKVSLPGFGIAKCKNGGEIVLINNEGMAFCSGIEVPKGESYALPLNIKLTYGYLSYKKGEFTIKKDIVEDY